MLKMMNRSQLLRILLWLPLLGFALISLYYIAGHHVWPLSRDQWHMYAPYFEHGFWQTMLSPMSTHRHIFPFFFFHMDMVLFNGLNHFLVACGAIFNGLVISLLLVALSREDRLSAMEKNSLGIFVVAELVWLLNIAQLGWGFMSTQYYLAIFTFLLAIYSAHQATQHQRRIPWLVLCISCGAISTFSFGMGILVWPCLVYFIWIWRAPKNLMAIILITFLACLLLFFLLPGGADVEKTLSFNPMEMLRFTLQLASGPIFFLLKSWRYFEIETCKQIASVVGISASIVGIAMMTLTAWRRPSLSIFKMLGHALVLLGLGTAALISLTRTSNFLDVWVDRYQIWGTLFWTGFLPLLYFQLKNFSISLSKWLITSMVCLPLLALPSQLDMGSRLYEYNVRVQESLLFYQVGIPEKQAAQDALHWNWEHKLSFLFVVLEHIKEKEKNIYYQSPAHYLGKSLDLMSGHWNVLPVTPSMEKIQPVRQEDLLGVEQYPELEKALAFLSTSNTNVVGYAIKAKIPDEIHWAYAVSTNQENIINGIGIHIHHSLLPRSNGVFLKHNYNFYGVVRYDDQPLMHWYLVTPIK